MEIERKYLVRAVPEDLDAFPSSMLEQVYINFRPAIRIRAYDGASWELTVKGPGVLAHEELNLPLSEDAYRRLYEKRGGMPIRKRRYRIPLPPYTVELDVFESPVRFVMAEVEFPSVEEADAFVPPAWFGKEVTYNPSYKNTCLAQLGRIADPEVP